MDKNNLCEKYVCEDCLYYRTIYGDKHNGRGSKWCCYSSDNGILRDVPIIDNHCIYKNTTNRTKHKFIVI